MRICLYSSAGRESSSRYSCRAQQGKREVSSSAKLQWQEQKQPEDSADQFHEKEEESTLVDNVPAKQS